MKVVLLRDVAKVGKKGELHEVSDGYGRNYLVVRGLAVVASEGKLRAVDKEKADKQAAAARAKAAAEAVGEKLTAKPITVSARAGEGGRLFGSITSQNLVEIIKEQTGIEVDKKVLKIDSPIRALGKANVTVKLHPEVKVQLVVDIVAE